MDILRFITAGNIDDGKSTLIGRLLHDTGNIKADILDSISGIGNTDNDVNLAHVTDGLRAERQAGITIDVAYKYFTTHNRKYIITDAPGHFQYTKNLVTGASNADVIIILIDAVNGILAQTRRHSLVASFLNVPHVIVAINKMDLVGFDEIVYERIKNEYLQIAESLKLASIDFIPVSALKGDNVITGSTNMPWYSGPSIFGYLETCTPSNKTAGQLRLSIQFTNDQNAYGRLHSGVISTGDKLVVNPGRRHVVVKQIISNYSEVTQAFAGQDIGIVVEGTKVKRGDQLSDSMHIPAVGNEIEANLCWLDDAHPLTIGKEYLLRLYTCEVACQVVEIKYIVDNDTFGQVARSEVRVNEFAHIRIETSEDIAFDTFVENRNCGRGILIDHETNSTSGAFVVL